MEKFVDIQQYLKNRVAFSQAELAKHRGEWVAFSPDGMRLVASAKDPTLLDSLILAAGENPEDCPIEGIPDTDCVVGGWNSP
jgi:hypothetical protein